MHSQGKNSKGLHTFGDDLDKGQALNNQNRFIEFNYFDPSNIDEDQSQEIERDWDNRMKNENIKPDSEDKNSCGVIKDSGLEMQTKSSEENITKGD